MLTEKEKVEMASKAIGKRLDYETLKYSDDMYGHESEIDSVWDYVVECDEIGRDAFKIKYKEFSLHWSL